jgi:hypothetical protein
MIQVEPLRFVRIFVEVGVIHSKFFSEDRHRLTCEIAACCVGDQLLFSFVDSPGLGCAIKDASVGAFSGSSG